MCTSAATDTELLDKHYAALLGKRDSCEGNAGHRPFGRNGGPSLLSDDENRSDYGRKESRPVGRRSSPAPARPRPLGPGRRSKSVCPVTCPPVRGSGRARPGTPELPCVALNSYTVSHRFDATVVAAAPRVGGYSQPGPRHRSFPSSCSVQLMPFRRHSMRTRRT